VLDGIFCRINTPDPTGGTVTVPVLPQPLHQQALQSSHDIPSASYQGVDKILHRLRREAYWVNMAGDVEGTADSALDANSARYQLQLEHLSLLCPLASHGR